MTQACNLPDGFPILSDDILAALDELNVTFEVEHGVPQVSIHVPCIDGYMSPEEIVLVNKLLDLGVVVHYTTRF